MVKWKQYFINKLYNGTEYYKYTNELHAIWSLFFPVHIGTTGGGGGGGGKTRTLFFTLSFKEEDEVGSADSLYVCN